MLRQSLTDFKLDRHNMSQHLTTLFRQEEGNFQHDNKGSGEELAVNIHDKNSKCTSKAIFFLRPKSS